MGVEGLENVSDESNFENEERHRDGGEAEKQEQEERREQDHEERRERLQEETPAPSAPVEGMPTPDETPAPEGNEGTDAA